MKNKIRSIYYGIQNVVRWIPVIWDDQDWDWIFLARILEYKLRRMSYHELTYGHHTTSKRDAKQQLICANLLARLVKDDYYENAELRFGNSTIAYKHGDSTARNDQRYLGLLLGKYLRNWWD